MSEPRKRRIKRMPRGPKMPQFTCKKCGNRSIYHEYAGHIYENGSMRMRCRKCGRTFIGGK